MHVAYFDLETTSTSTKSDILQISAETESENYFNKFTFPKTWYINRGAQRVHAISIVDDKLCKNGEVIPDVVSAEEGLEDFKNFLDDLRHNDEDKIVLCAYNGLRFDSKVLAHNLVENGVELPTNLEFRDSLDILKKYKEQIGKKYFFFEIHLIRFKGVQN